MSTDRNLRTDDINRPNNSGRKITRSANDPSSLRTDDVNPPKRQFLNRTINLNEDATGGAPVSYNVSSLQVGDIMYQKPTYTNKTDGRFNVRDITGGQQKRRVSKRVVNPLNPIYTLPSYEVEAPHEPKFVYDGFDISDIEGSRPTRHTNKFKTRDNINYSDVAGTSSRVLHKVRRGESPNTLNVGDITDTKFKSTRLGHNPLEPTYVLSGASGLLAHHGTDSSVPAAKVVIGSIEGTSPTKPKRGRKDEDQFALRTDDICKPGVRNAWETRFPNNPRRSWRSVNVTSDIPGAQADSIVHIQSNRVTNPLERKYRLPGHSEAAPNVPYLERETYEERIAKARAKAQEKKQERRQSAASAREVKKKESQVQSEAVRRSSASSKRTSTPAESKSAVEGKYSERVGTPVAEAGSISGQQESKYDQYEQVEGKQQREERKESSSSVFPGKSDKNRIRDSMDTLETFKTKKPHGLKRIGNKTTLSASQKKALDKALGAMSFTKSMPVASSSGSSARVGNSATLVSPGSRSIIAAKGSRKRAHARQSRQKEINMVRSLPSY